MQPYSQTRVPPLSANLGQTCYKCFKDESLDDRLQRCSGCRRVAYCSADCQKSNWIDHKTICKALRRIESDEALRRILIFSFADAPNDDFVFVNELGDQDTRNKIQFLQRFTCRPLSMIERNLIAWEPRCMACARTEQIIRIEVSVNPSANLRSMIPCPNCKTSFCCSDEHWEAVHHRHSKEPSVDGHDGLSQCELNQEIRSDVAFSNSMTKIDPSFATFQWAPERTKAGWMSLEGATWASEFGADIAQELSLPPDRLFLLLRSASEALSMPMTILWALEKLNDDLSWTVKETLTVHIIGAYQPEVTNSRVFEEILHRLPSVKVLQLVFRGPEIAKLIYFQQCGETVDMETCPSCCHSGRKRLHEHYADTYHAYVKKQGNKFAQPDLAVAFNSGLSQEAVASWTETIETLIKRKIPSVFTAYNREEAEAEARIITAAGAKLVPTLGPTKNVWGTLRMHTEPSKVVGFYSVNGWLAGGFK